MRFAIQLRYSLHGQYLEISKDDVAFLEGKKIWTQANDNLLTTCKRVGPHAAALAMTAQVLRKICSWATVKSFRGDTTTFELTVPEEKADDFEHLVKTGEMKRQLNEAFQDLPKDEENEDQPESTSSNTLSGVAVTSLQMDPGEPIAVLLEGKDDSPVLDHDALAKVFLHENVGNRPVALISIAGAFRKGKSFMLNFFLRYLRNKGYKYEDWLGDPDTPLDDGFAWRGGAKRHTEGITMWSEPFIVRRHGEEVAVFLMDTQGNFDNKAGKEQCTKIFAISMLLSSVLVFNIHTQIQENDLGYLEFAAEYGRVTKDHKEKISPFQKLLFLVRDWSSLDDFDYGLDGGQEYLEKIVLQDDPDAVNKSLGKTRKHLQESFGSISCYLMPEPGKEVRITRKGEKFDGSLKHIDKDFLEHVERLTHTLLHPDNLVIKECMTAKSLMYFIIGCCNAIKTNKDGKLPVPTTIMETAAESLATASFIQCVDHYGDEMQKALKKSQSFLPWEEFEQCEEDIRTKAKETFYESLKFGDESFKKRQTEKLADYLKRAKLKFTRRNKMNEMKDKDDIDQLILLFRSVYEEEFKKALEEQSPDCFGQDHFLETMHGELVRETEETFLSEISKSTTKQNYEEEKNALRKEILDTYELVKIQFQSTKETMEIKLQDVVCESVQKYEEEMQKALKDFSDGKCEVTEKDIANFHVRAEIEARSHFDDKKSMTPESMQTASRKQLEEFISDSKRNFLEVTAREQEALKNSLLKEMVKKYAEYNDMETGAKIVSRATMQKISKKFYSLAVGVYDAWKAAEGLSGATYSFDDWIKEQKNLLDLSLRQLKFREAKAMCELLQLKVSFTKKILDFVKGILPYYWAKEELEKCLKEKDENFFNDIKEAELKRYASDDGKSRRYAEEMREVAQKAFDVARRRNARNEIRIQHKLELDLLEKTLKYSEAIEEELKGAYVEPKVLDEMHEKLVENLLTKKLSGLTDKAYEIHEKRIKDKLNEHFQEFKKWNEENKSFFTRVVGRVAAGFATTEALAVGGAAGGLFAAQVLSLGAAAAVGGVALGAAALGGALIVGIGGIISWSLTSKNMKEYFAKAKINIRNKMQNVKKGPNRKANV